MPRLTRHCRGIFAGVERISASAAPFTARQGSKLMAEQLPEPREPAIAVKPPRRLSRRQFLALAAIAGAAGTSLVIGVTLYEKHHPTLKPSTKPLTPNLWVRIDPDNTITVRVAKSEM